ncbi:MAG TPA: (d)CMP kinase [Ktedonobacterales bacterium]|nr:(d)CMP kinase [Ktedonobacterales bacterium]
MPRPLRIAIDGPAGSGKSTIGERLARRLGAVFVDTGAMYRALTVLVLAAGVDPADEQRCGDLAERARIDMLPPTVADGRQYTVLLDGRDITHELRTPAVEQAISAIARQPRVRRAMRLRQQVLAPDYPVVMVGRDIGTVVLPAADLKFQLLVSVDERARRRHGDLVAERGAAAPSFEQVRADLARRDELDAGQMQPAADAITIHTDDLRADDVVALMLERIGRLHD